MQGRLFQEFIVAGSFLLFPVQVHHKQSLFPPGVLRRAAAVRVVERLRQLGGGARVSLTAAAATELARVPHTRCTERRDTFLAFTLAATPAPTGPSRRVSREFDGVGVARRIIFIPARFRCSVVQGNGTGVGEHRRQFGSSFPGGRRG